MNAESTLASLTLHRHDQQMSLKANGMSLPINARAARLAHRLLSNPDPLASPLDDCEEGEARLVEDFLMFYFCGQRSLSKNVNYARLVLPERYHHLRSAPEEVTFLVSNACNMRCPHCYNNSGEVAQGELSSAERREVADYIARWGVRAVTLTGGEPLVHKDTVPIMNLFAERRVLMKVSTNGWSVAERVYELVAERKIFQFNVSLDGARAEVHDAYRRLAGSFVRVMETLRRLHELGLPLLNINVAVHDGNLDQLDDICAIAERFKATSVAFKPVLMSGRPELQIGQLPTVSNTPFLSVAGVERFRQMREQLREKYTNDRMIVAGIINSANLTEAENDAMDCGGGKKALFIASNGDLTPCELVTEFMQVPNVRRDSPIAYWLTGKGLNDFRGMTQELRNQDAEGISGCPGVIFRRKSLPLAASRFLETFEGASS